MDLRIGNTVTKLNLRLSREEQIEARFVLLALGKFLHTTPAYKQFIERRHVAQTLASMMGETVEGAKTGALESDQIFRREVIPYILTLANNAKSPLSASIIRQVADYLSSTTPLPRSAAPSPISFESDQPISPEEAFSPFVSTAKQLDLVNDIPAGMEKKKRGRLASKDNNHTRVGKREISPESDRKTPSPVPLSNKRLREQENFVPFAPLMKNPRNERHF
jgi:hypothetical protein